MKGLYRHPLLQIGASGTNTILLIIQTRNDRFSKNAVRKHRSRKGTSNKELEKNMKNLPLYHETTFYLNSIVVLVKITVLLIL